jgi:hypothetical protein
MSESFAATDLDALVKMMVGILAGESIIFWPSPANHALQNAELSRAGPTLRLAV